MKINPISPIYKTQLSLRKPREFDHILKNLLKETKDNCPICKRICNSYCSIYHKNKKNYF